VEVRARIGFEQADEDLGHDPPRDGPEVAALLAKLALSLAEHVVPERRRPQELLPDIG